MTCRTFRWLLTLSVLVALAPLEAWADDGGWAAPNAPEKPGPACAAVLGNPVPAVTLGAPEPLATLGQPEPLSETVTPVNWSNPSPEPAPEGEMPMWVPRLILRGQMPEETIALYGPPPVPPPVSGANPFPPPNDVPAGPPPPPPPSVGLPNQGVAVDQPLNPSFWDKCGDFFKNLTHCGSESNRCLFQSDQSFCNTPFASPVTNPFLSFNPLSLTEIRPIYMFQGIPSGNPVLGGGNAQFYGAQGSLAINDQLSFVLDKVGWVTLAPNSHVPPAPGTATGFGELWLGPKWTFFRCPDTGSAVAAGLTFQIPCGEDKVFQGTGTLGLDPYICFAQNIRLGGYGSINLMNTTGYVFAVDDQRSDYFHASFHIDYDIANAHTFFPMIELNWFQYTTNGKVTPVNFEGTDLFNIGATANSGNGYVTLGPALRYRFNDHLQMGLGGEWMLTGPKSLEDFRLTVDLILRY